MIVICISLFSLEICLSILNNLVSPADEKQKMRSFLFMICFEQIRLQCAKTLYISIVFNIDFLLQIIFYSRLFDKSEYRVRLQTFRYNSGKQLKFLECTRKCCVLILSFIFDFFCRLFEILV